MAAVAEPPVATPPPNTPPVREFKASDIKPPSEPAAPPKPGSARDGMIERLKASAKPDPTQPNPPASTKPADKPTVSEVEDPDEPTTDKPPTEPETDPAKKGKVSPWKLVEEYKAKAAALEAEKLELSKRALPKEEWEKTQSTIEAERKRNAELESEIVFVNYSKSKEFQEKYVAPYDEAWKKAMVDLGELKVEAGGEERPIQPADILELVNLPLPEARAKAEEVYGVFANDVMEHRKEIKNLFDKQQAALTEAKTKGVERTKQMAELTKRQQEEMSLELRTNWTMANEEALTHPKYGSFFKPSEGDEQGNQRLAKGFELADRAFSENPAAPGLTPEQRKSIVQRHAAVRNRAAAFGKLVYLNEQKDATIADLQKRLEEYQSSEPGAGGGRKPPTTPEAKSGFAGLSERLQKIAK